MTDMHTAAHRFGGCCSAVGHPCASASRRCAEGWPLRWHHPGCCAGVFVWGAVCQGGHSHDRRAHPARPCATCGRHQGKAVGCTSSRCPPPPPLPTSSFPDLTAELPLRKLLLATGGLLDMLLAAHKAGTTQHPHPLMYGPPFSPCAQNHTPLLPSFLAVTNGHA